MANKRKVKGYLRFEYDGEVLGNYFYSGINENGISRVQRKLKIQQFISKKTKHPKYIIFSPIIN